MKPIRVLCIVLALLLPACALATDLEEVIASLPDDELVELCTLAMVEAYFRGFSPQDLAGSVLQEYQERISQPTPPPQPEQRPKCSTLQDVQTVLEYDSSTQTFVAYNPSATIKPTFAPLVQLEDDDVVWISKTGKRYHTVPDCSGMSTPREVSLSLAINKGLTPCRDCAYWMPETED